MRRSALLGAAALVLVAGALGYVAVTGGDAPRETTADTPRGTTGATPHGSVPDAPGETTDAALGTADDTPRETVDATPGTAEVGVATLRPLVVVGNESDSVPAGARTDVSCTDQKPFPGNATFRVSLTASDGALRTNGTVTLAPGESTQTHLTTLVDQPPSVHGDDTVTVRAVVRAGNRTVATSARTADVAERNVPCADGE